MRLNIYIITILSVIITGCKTSESHHTNNPHNIAFLDEHSSKNSLNWQGTYIGTLPCADCNGIVTQIKINQDFTYTKKEKYLGKDDHDKITKGNFVWDDIGSNVIIENTSYMVGENTLIQLNQQKENIKGALATEYVLAKKVIDTLLTDVTWELISLQGKKIEKENLNIPYFTINSTDDNIYGNSGCNQFHGSFVLKTGQRISFSKIAATQKLCFNAPYEGNLLKVLETIDNYSIKNDTLSLNKAKMAPLAKFVMLK